MNIDDNYDNDGTTIETPASNIRPPVLRSASEERDTVTKLVAQVGGRRARNILAIPVGRRPGSLRGRTDYSTAREATCGV
jgi:hypothetical protein